MRRRDFAVDNELEWVVPWDEHFQDQEPEEVIHVREVIPDQVICPFCNDDDYDLVGLKFHLEHYCEAFDKIIDPDVPSRRESRTEPTKEFISKQGENK